MMGLPGGAIGRMREVVTVMMWEGLSIPLARMRVARCASLRCRVHCTWQRWTGRAASRKPWPIALRDAFVRLGPAFVKIGQILSVRSDLVPENLAQALHSLQSDVPPEKFDDLRPVIEGAIGQPIGEYFASFDERPLAAGSVAQVHVGQTHAGDRVAVKVRRPGIDAIVERDLEILVWLAAQLEDRVEDARPLRPKAAAEELRRYTLRELDFRNEAQVAIELRERFTGRADVVIPQIHHSAEDLLVMDYVEGFPLDDLESIDEHGLDRARIVRVGLEAVLAQIFEFGLFHGDPHPGNLHVTPDGKIALLDFGIFGRIDEHLQQLCVLLMLTLVRGDVDLASHFLLRMGRIEPGADVAGFRAAIEQRYQAWHGATVEEYGFARLVYEEFSLGARHGVIFPSDLVLLGKAMVTVEGAVLSVDPTLDISREAKPYLEGLRARLFALEPLRDAVERSWPLWWDVVQRMPVGLAEWMDRAMREPPAAPLPSHNPRSASTLPWLAVLTIGGGTTVLAMQSTSHPAWTTPLGVVLVGLGCWLVLTMRGALR